MVGVGLRGRMEAGFSRMNDLTVIQTSQVGEPYLWRPFAKCLSILGIVRICSQKCGQRGTAGSRYRS